MWVQTAQYLGLRRQVRCWSRTRTFQLDSTEHRTCLVVDRANIGTSGLVKSVWPGVRVGYRVQTHVAVTRSVGARSSVAPVA